MRTAIFIAYNITWAVLYIVISRFIPVDFPSAALTMTTIIAQYLGELIAIQLAIWIGVIAFRRGESDPILRRNVTIVLQETLAFFVWTCLALAVLTISLAFVSFHHKIGAAILVNSLIWLLFHVYRISRSLRR